VKFPNKIPVYGDKKFRGNCPPEAAEQVTFFNWIRRQYPYSWGILALHPRNEGERTHYQTMKQKSEGMTPGASDIVIPGSPAFVCEMKRRDHTKCKWQDGQIEYLQAAQHAGAFVCIALGYEAAREAFTIFLSTLQK
jgi:hypothetical protein